MTGRPRASYSSDDRRFALVFRLRFAEFFFFFLLALFPRYGTLLLLYAVTVHVHTDDIPRPRERGNGRTARFLRDLVCTQILNNIMVGARRFGARCRRDGSVVYRANRNAANPTIANISFAFYARYFSNPTENFHRTCTLRVRVGNF